MDSKHEYQMERLVLNKYCYKKYLSYKYRCNKVRDYVVGKQDYEKDLTLMNLRELQDYYHFILNLSKMSRNCGLYRDMFRNECVPQNKRNSNHQYEITSSLEFSNRCDTLLLNICKSIFERIKESENKNKNKQKVQTIQNNTSTSQPPNENISVLRNLKEDIDTYILKKEQPFTDENVQKLLQEYKDEQEEYYIKIGEQFYNLIEEAKEGLEFITNYDKTQTQHHVKQLLLEQLVRLEPLQLLSVYVNFYYIKQLKPFPSLKSVYNDILGKNINFTNINEILFTISIAETGFDNINTLYDFITKNTSLKTKIYVELNNKPFLIKMMFLYIFLDKKNYAMVDVVLNNFNEIMRDYKNIVQGLTVIDKCKVITFLSILYEHLTIRTHLIRAERTFFLTYKNETYEKVVKTFAGYFKNNNTDIPQIYLKTCVQIYVYLISTNFFNIINRIPVEDKHFDNQPIYKYSDDHLIWFIDNLAAYKLKMGPFGKYSNVPDIFIYS